VVRAVAAGKSREQIRDLYEAELRSRGLTVPPDRLLGAYADALAGNPPSARAPGGDPGGGYGGGRGERAGVRVGGPGGEGEETPESDIDLLVDFPAGERGLFPLLTMVEEVEQLLGRPVESWGDRDGSSPATRSRAAR